MIRIPLRKANQGCLARAVARGKQGWLGRLGPVEGERVVKKREGVEREEEEREEEERGVNLEARVVEARGVAELGEGRVNVRSPIRERRARCIPAVPLAIHPLRARVRSRRVREVRCIAASFSLPTMCTRAGKFWWIRKE